MDLLLDTHAFIWFLNGNKELPAKGKDLIENTDNNCFISIASIQEIAIKSSINKLDLNGDFNEIAEFISDNDIQLLPLTFQHIQRLLSLRYHHRDPFDRIIIAQASSENLIIITKDAIFSDYEANIIWK